MVLKKLTLKDKGLLERYLSLTRHELSAFTLANIYIWKGLFEISWKITEDNLCLFFRDNTGSFMYLPPLGSHKSRRALEDAFGVMDGCNKNKDISRVENIEAGDTAWYKELGYSCLPKYPEYLCRRRDLADLKGNNFKSQRASFNYFVKNQKFEYLPFSLKYKNDCLKLYDLWAKERRARNEDDVYQWMLQDSRKALVCLLEDYAHLDCLGRIIRIGKKIKAFTFGFRLNQDTFCVSYEIADLSIKGIAQFIFRSFCSDLKEYKYINVMDDSGLENIKRAKLGYHPLRLVPAYIAKRLDA